MRVGFLALPLVALAVTATAQQSIPVGSNVSQVLALMQSASWSDRSEGMQAAIAALGTSQKTSGDAEKLKLGLMQLLSAETSTARNPATKIPDEEREGYSNYFGDLIEAVAELNDPRTIPSLLAVANTGGLATRGIAQFGKAALDPVIQQTTGQDSQLAEGAVFVIRDMLAFHTVSDPESLGRIKNALRSALSSPDWEMRESSVYAIEFLKDRDEFVSLLTEVSKSDPFKTDGQGGEVYPLRRMATILLTKIANHAPPPLTQ